jgi:ribokinase
MRVAVVGHTEWVWFGTVDRIPGPGEIAHSTHAHEEPGGGGAVAAVQLARLAGGCDFFTALGDDVFGGRAIERLTRLGVTVHAAIREGWTRRALTQIGPAGERTITTLGPRLAPAAADPLPWDRLAGADATYVTAGDAGAFERGRASGVLVVTTRALDVLLGSGVTPDALVGSARDEAERVEIRALPWQPRLIVATEGIDGGWFVTPDGGRDRYEAVRDAPEPEPRADTYGAGDSFAAGLTFALGRGLGTDAAVALAARCGAWCASGAGPYDRQFTAADL